jgi:hypothetical protein
MMMLKTLALLIMLVALFFLYRIAFPKQTESKKGKETHPKPEPDLSEVIIKSRFVRPETSQPQPTSATVLQSDIQHEKPPIFAAGNEERSAVVPPEKVQIIFLENEPEPDELEIVCDENESSDNEDLKDSEVEAADLDEEAEEIRQTLGSDAEQASSGLSIEELTEVAAAVNNPTDDKAGILFKVEKTDMFEQLVSGNEGLAERIKAIIDRHVGSYYNEEVNADLSPANDGDWNDFDINKYL